MRRLTFAAVLTVVTIRMAQANLNEVGTQGTQSVSGSLILDYTIAPTGPVTNLQVYFPRPRASTYSTFWSHGVSGENFSVYPTTGPQIFPHPGGYWVLWDWHAAATSWVRHYFTRSVSVNLPGITSDITGSGGGAWCQFTERCQNFPGLSETMTAINDNVMPSTAQGVWGQVERTLIWLKNNVTYNSGFGDYDENDAQSAYENRQATCAGYANLFKAMRVTSGNCVGIALGGTLTGSEIYPGPVSGSFSVSTSSGLHAWATIDDGATWLHVEPYTTLGFVSATRFLFDVFEDESHGNMVVLWSRPPGTSYTVNVSTTVTGSSSGATYQAKDQRNPDPGNHYAVHWLAAADLKPTQPGPPVDVVESPALDTAKANTFLVFYNRGAGWLEARLYLERPAHVRADVYDVAGRHVAQALDQDRQAGYNYFVWPPVSAASGVYLMKVTLDHGRQVETKKFTILR